MSLYESMVCRLHVVSGSMIVWDVSYMTVWYVGCMSYVDEWLSEMYVVCGCSVVWDVYVLMSLYGRLDLYSA